MHNKKDEELKFGQFFIERFNQYYKLNYQVFPNDAEKKKDREIDIYVIGKDCGILSLQITTGEHELKEIFPALKKESRKTSQNIIISSPPILNTKKSIVEAIKRKGKYSSEIKKTLVVLITKEWGPIFDKDYVKKNFSNPDNLIFKGVYMVNLPSRPNMASHPHQGQVVAIKDIFGNHGIIF